MSQSSSSEGFRQDQLQQLFEQAGRAPGIADVMTAYEQILKATSVRIVLAPGRVTYSTGGNS